MRVLHVIPSLHPSQGGPSTVMPQIAKALVEQGVTVDIVCVDPVTEVNDQGAWVETSPHGYRILTFPPKIKLFRFSAAMVRWLHRHATHYDIIHTHGVFSVPTLAAEWAATRHDVPLVVRPLGILNRWGMENRKAIIKQLWFRLLEKPLLNQAAAMHYTSREEADDVARLAIQAPAEVLPLGLDMTPFAQLPPPSLFRERFRIQDHEKVILFLSRIHPKKGLEVLFEAFAVLHQSHPETRLFIAGDGETPYVAELRRLCETLAITEAVTWTGFLNPEDRLQALSASDLFCLPSNSENFGIALLEAMAAGLPCISSPEVALAQEPPTQNAVLVVERQPALWTQAMQDLLLHPDKAAALADHAVQVCRDHYSTKQMGGKLVRLYGQIAPRRALTTGQADATPSLRNGILPQITPVILTWNEEANLKRCLERLTWASQIVVIDSGSSDATLAIASEFTHVRVLIRPFDTHTHQWNYGIDQAETEWVLTLDADYILGEGFVDELAELSPPSRCAAYRANFRYCVFGQPLGASLYPPRAILFRKNQCRYFQDGHTQLLKVDGELEVLRSTISHDDRKPFARWLSSQAKYAKLEADKLLQSPPTELTLPDRLRRTGWAAIPAAIGYTLIAKRTLLDGCPGWYYALQRTLAEVMLALEILDRRLRRDDELTSRRQSEPAAPPARIHS